MCVDLWSHDLVPDTAAALVATAVLDDLVVVAIAREIEDLVVVAIAGELEDLVRRFRGSQLFVPSFI